MRVVGLGSIPAAGWRPTRGWENTHLTVGTRPAFTPASLRSVVDSAEARAAARLFTPAYAVETCGQPGGVPCDSGTPQAALAGFVDNTFCPSFARELERSAMLLAEAKRIGLTGPVVDAVQKRYDDEHSWAFWRASSVISTGACKQATSEVSVLNSALSAALQPAGGNVTVAPPALPPPSEGSGISSTVKTVAVAAAVIAGVVIAAPLVFEGVAWAKLARKARAR